MNDNEIHYLAYDPEEVWTAMVTAYIEAGGDVLYPGDEKEILLRGVQAIAAQTLAGVDNALRMATLRYAVRDYLDLYGENRNCHRNKAAAATAKVEITFSETGVTKIIPKSTPLTAGDGDVLYLLSEDVTQTGLAQKTTIEVVCNLEGSIGNSLLAGMQMQFLAPQNAVVNVVCTESAAGGQDEEDDETYRERIRTFGLMSTTTGPQAQYESAAKNVTSEILDARALNAGDGIVGVYLLLNSETGAAAIIESVEKALNAESVRPLTDTVVVSRATQLKYTLNIQYSQEAGSNITAAIAAAVEEYRAWQDETIGRPFNPDKLMVMLYQAGALRVTWGEGSNFNGGDVVYTEIAKNAHCRGEIKLAVVT